MGCVMKRYQIFQLYFGTNTADITGCSLLIPGSSQGKDVSIAEAISVMGHGQAWLRGPRPASRSELVVTLSVLS